VCYPPLKVGRLFGWALAFFWSAHSALCPAQLHRATRSASMRASLPLSRSRTHRRARARRVCARKSVFHPRFSGRVPGRPVGAPY
jgi:hypothetical protein